MVAANERQPLGPLQAVVLLDVGAQEGHGAEVSGRAREVRAGRLVGRARAQLPGPLEAELVDHAGREVRRQLRDRRVAAVLLRPVGGERVRGRRIQRRPRRDGVFGVVVAEVEPPRDPLLRSEVVVELTHERRGVVGLGVGPFQRLEVIERFRAVGRGRCRERREQDLARVTDGLALEGAEIKGLVPADRPAERPSPLLLREDRRLAEGVRPVQVRVPAGRAVAVRQAEGLVSEEVEGAAVDVVRSRARDRVDDAAATAPELGGETLRRDLELGDRFLRDRERVVGALAAADPAEERLVVVRAVDAHVAVDPALPQEGKLVALRLDEHRGGAGDEVVEAAPVDRQVVDGAQIDDRAVLGARALQPRPGHDDLRRDAADLQREVRVAARPHVNVDHERGFLEPGVLGDDFVAPRRERDDAVEARIGRDGRARQPRRLVRGGDGGARNRRAGLVRDGSDHLTAGCLGLGEQ